MELEPNSDRIPVGRFDRTLLRPLARAPHGGDGLVLYREVYGQRDFRSMFSYVRHYELSPGATIGSYTRTFIEEVFVVLAGRGTMHIGGETIEISKGDVVFAGLGETRSISNSTAPAEVAAEPLELFNVGAAMSKGVDAESDAVTTGVSV
eukprot:SAG22_NODE_350_length_11853_cov_3.693211_2_plen_150_part_00